MSTETKRAVVKRTGRTWGVFVGGRLVEGGFFTRDAAVRCAEDLNWGGVAADVCPGHPENDADRGTEAQEFTETPRGYRARERWARLYEDLNGAPENDSDR